MARGFLSGTLWGGVLSVGVAGVASVMAPLSSSPDVSDLAPHAAEASDAATAEAGDGRVAPITAETVVETAQTASQTQSVDPDGLGRLDGDVTVSARVPVTGQADSLVTPEVAPQTDSVALQTEAPVFPNPQALAPMSPQEPDDLSISTEPAQPPQPVTDTLDMAGDASATAPSGSSPEDVDTDLRSEDAQQVTIAPRPAPAVVVAKVAEEPTGPEAETKIEQAAAPKAVEDAEEPAPEEMAEAEPAEPVVSETIGTPATPLTERENTVTVNRPTNNAANSGTAEEEQPVTVITQEGTVAPGEDSRPVAVYAESFENPDDKPLMSILLIDAANGPTAGEAGIAALRSFPYPISFAVDASLADAADRMELYRAAGFEVMAMVDLPAGAQVNDAETTLGAVFAQMPKVVGVLEGTDAGLQETREVADQVTAILAQSGHGLVTQDKGLNTMPKLARKEGVPATPIFRDFDSKGQNATVIRRFLDQAAFKAGQEGAVIMLGRLRPDTISALLLWGLQDRAGKVALAPISAVLRNGEE